MRLKKLPVLSMRLWALIALTIALLTAGPGGAVLQARADESVSEKVGAVAAETEKKIQDTRQTTKSEMHELWKRIDEKRLKNRTPDEIIAWIIMGLLVGGLIQRFSKRSWPVTLFLGLLGAFIGGIAANLIQLNLQWGPVLIRYEELMASLLGGILIVLAARFLGQPRNKKTG